jgi:hypothetical protein
VTSQGEAWFSALGEPLGDAERSEIAAYLWGLAMPSPVHAVRSWQEAFEICVRPAEAWWNAEEAEGHRLKHKVKLNPAEPQCLSLNEVLHGASYAAYQARLALAAGASQDHPFLRKYALYCGGRWPLGVYQGRFAIF